MDLYAMNKNTAKYVSQITRLHEQGNAPVFSVRPNNPERIQRHL
jgi:hypothetical protein